MDSMDSSDFSEDGSDGVHSDDEAPLTKATLLTFTEMERPWLSVGEGVVAVEVSIEGAEPPPPPTAGGKVGKAETSELTSALVSQRVGRLVMVDLTDADEVLLSTPIDVEGLFQVQDGKLLMWEDAQLGRTMAFNFDSEEGCQHVLRIINDFQRSEQARKAAEEDVTNSGTASALPGGKAGAAGVQKLTDRFAVSVANLPGIHDAVNSNPIVFGIYVRDDMTYFRQLAGLFEERRAAGDAQSLDHIAQITLRLMGTPYNSEGKVLGQFMESAYVDKCVDIVQYALGRKDRESGFVSLEERRASFKNPLALPESILQRIHLLYSAMYLRDLLPLSLDEGDGGSPCVLNILLLRFKFTLISEICTKPEFLRHAFEVSQLEDADSASLYALVDFVHDISKLIKNSPIPFDMKEDLYQTIIQDGLFLFCNAVLRRGLKDVEAENATTCADVANRGGGSVSERSAAAKAVEAACDIVSHSLFIVPSSREALKTECRERPHDCTLTLAMKCLTLMRNSSALQAAYDVVQGAAVGIAAMQLYQASMNLGAQRDIVRFWIEGSGVERPPLFLVASHIAGVLETVRPPAASAVATPARGLNTAEERQIVFGIRVLNTVVEKVEEGFRTSFVDTLRLSNLLPAIGTLMRQHRARQLENVQSSCVAFVAKLVTMGKGNVMRLFEPEDGEGSQADEEGRESLLAACMSLYLTCSRRNTILSASLGSLFVSLSTEVHNEKVHVADTAANSPFMHPSFVTPMDGSNPLSPDVAAASRDLGSEGRYQMAATALMALYGEQLEEQAPMVAERLKTSLAETPEEAKNADVGTPSLPSTICRGGEGLSEYDAVALDFGLDVQAEMSRSLSCSPLKDSFAAVEDSLLSSLMDSSSSDDDDDIDAKSGEDDGLDDGAATLSSNSSEDMGDEEAPNAETVAAPETTVESANVETVSVPTPAPVPTAPPNEEPVPATTTATVSTPPEDAASHPNGGPSDSLKRARSEETEEQPRTAEVKQEDSVADNEEIPEKKSKSKRRRREG